MIYVVCLMRQQEIDHSKPPNVIGLDGESFCEFIYFREIVAVTCRVKEELFSEIQLERNMQDPAWIQVKGAWHHDCIANYYGHYTVIPMSFGTIFSSEGSLFESLEGRYEAIQSLLTRLEEKEEWNVRSYCDDKRLSNHIELYSPGIADFMKQLDAMPAGKRFLMRKKLERMIEDEALLEKAERCRQLHQNLEAISVETVTNRIWPRAVTGKMEEMVANHAYLIDKKKRNELIEHVRRYQQETEAIGWSHEASGPWPPYHFSKLT
jgi:hypothetical protein